MKPRTGELRIKAECTGASHSDASTYVKNFYSGCEGALALCALREEMATP
jgi:hypothetical protein